KTSRKRKWVEYDKPLPKIVSKDDYEKDVRSRLREFLVKEGMSDEKISVLEQRPLHYAYAPELKNDQ
ncbi:hypothetical protein PMAYCL1PPCAC_22851, partial [Pristionchus mayeri]